MAHYIIEVPVHIYEAVLEFQDRVLRREIDAKSPEARAEFTDLIGPYCHTLPDENDTTEIKLYKPLMVTLH